MATRLQPNTAGIWFGARLARAGTLRLLIAGQNVRLRLNRGASATCVAATGAAMLRRLGFAARCHGETVVMARLPDIRLRGLARRQHASEGISR